MLKVGNLPDSGAARKNIGGGAKMTSNVKAGGIRCVEILCIENKAGVWG